MSLSLQLKGDIMKNEKTTFALFIGHRGPFSPEVMAGARKEMPTILKKLGYETIMLDADATAYGAVETGKEGRVFAEFLHKNRGNFDGVILCLPNFGDENGAVEALKDAGVPILMQAYPDELIKPTDIPRRDAFCGKIAIMDLFCQYEIPFTALKPASNFGSNPPGSIIKILLLAYHLELNVIFTHLVKYPKSSTLVTDVI